MQIDDIPSVSTAATQNLFMLLPGGHHSFEASYVGVRILKLSLGPVAFISRGLELQSDGITLCFGGLELGIVPAYNGGDDLLDLFHVGAKANWLRGGGIVTREEVGDHNGYEEADVLDNDVDVVERFAREPLWESHFEIY